MRSISKQHGEVCRKATAAALVRMLEEHTYFCYVYSIWVCKNTSAEILPLVTAALPIPGVLKPLAISVVRMKMTRDLKGQVPGYSSLLVKA